jgi:nucleotide-binding universal stress UspA family protein
MTQTTAAESFRKLLVPVSDAREDLETVVQAGAFARERGASVMLLGVVEAPPDLSRLSRASGVGESEIIERLVEDRRAELARLAAEAELSVEPACEVRVGKPFLEIIRAVSNEGYDLVIKTAETVSGLRARVFASTDQHLLRKCACPVWLRMPGAKRKARSVIAAVDVDPVGAAEPETQNALNQRILRTAIEAAVFQGAMLEVLHVWDAPGEVLVSRWIRDESQVRAYRDELESALRVLLNALIGDIAAQAPDSLRITPVLARGAPQHVIAEHVKRSRAGVLVMGTVARTGVPGFLIGNTAEDLLNKVDCSVIAVKPPGYVSPIR